MRYIVFAAALLAAAPGLLLAAVPAEAAALLHPMFADHAVLQRDQPIPVYGQAKPGAEVSVQLGNAKATAHADKDGQWRAALPAMPAGGPYTLHVSSGGDSQDVQDVLLGDVFLCTGQSNMQVSVRGAANADGRDRRGHRRPGARTGGGPHRPAPCRCPLSPRR